MVMVMGDGWVMGDGRWCSRAHDGNHDMRQARNKTKSSSARVVVSDEEWNRDAARSQVTSGDE